MYASTCSFLITRNARADTATQTISAPLAAITMAGILFVYARTSIHAARLNAQKHREMDGGQLSWANESMRRHGQRERVDERTLLKEALLGDKSSGVKERDSKSVVGGNEASSAPANALENFKKEQRLQQFLGGKD
jgi:hypothetical protein